MRPVRLGLLAAAIAAGLASGAAGQRPSPAPPPAAGLGPGGASNLRLAPDLSFTDDSSANFPIRGDGLDDGRVASDRPTVLFFGTSHCWNTNREAERFVKFYAAHRDEARFLVVDLERPSSAQRVLVERFYRGLIPTVVFLDRSGAVVSDRPGETARDRGDVSGLETLLKKSL